MSYLLAKLVPANLADWRMEVVRLPGIADNATRTVATARRNGVTLILAESAGWWTVTKLHKGQELDCVIVHHRSMPRDVLKIIERRRKEQRAREAQYLSGRRATAA